MKNRKTLWTTALCLLIVLGILSVVASYTSSQGLALIFTLLDIAGFIILLWI